MGKREQITKRGFLVVLVWSSWCYTTLNMSNSPARSYPILTLGFHFPISILSSIWLGDGRPCLKMEIFFFYSIKLWDPVMISCFIYFHLHMIVSASYLFPVEPRLVLGKEIEKSGFYSSLEHSVLLFSRVWLGLMGLLISLVRQDGSKSTRYTHYLKGDAQPSLYLEWMFCTLRLNRLKSGCFST